MSGKNVMAFQDVTIIPRQVIDVKWSGRSSFSIRETAEILGISVWAAYSAAKKGDLPVIAIGRRLIIPRHALEKLMLST